MGTKDFLSRIRHPCYSEAMHSLVGRIHLPLARKCNIHCRYCERRIGVFYHSTRPGVAARVISPRETAQYIRRELEKCPAIEVIAIAGPGEPLANRATFAALSIARRAFPEKKLCICTNGLLLPDKVAQLKKLGVSFITVTINAATPETARKVYSFVRYRGRVYRGTRAAELLVGKQFEGLEKAVRAGIEVKVNSVYIPGINDEDLPLIAKRAKDAGARIMNVMPLISSGELSDHKSPTCAQLRNVRKRCEELLPVFRLCKQCRADACGVPGT